ncbi:hypothetical protein SODALDRAFT_335353 [Sodiomyces alkalinus F11]|uniref:Arrestin C-terminal-like domain-containing protein n=1 Tax=Sodiomyces alkalinus (strain CBS 110278 / VKM F-3762 / F11) TaxID=1314773 RepID=A0A3N2PP30_SODAK|nr:hypothetical protein SODALDRAFT_335353 [Sodiomyces alkalinus F11]ROT36277.1 hypothetical protein SODALDRAFT_335353 [Sodiomyces alkalinus F11]
MLSFKPFSNVAGRNSASLFQVRLDKDFIVFRGSEAESAGQTLKGSVVLCLSSPLKVEAVHLRLTGNLRFSWDLSKPVAPGISGHRVDRNIELLKHRWQPFVKGHSGEKVVLEPGNYEWPFKLDLPGDMPESVEGIPEASIMYRLKATIVRGKLSHDMHAYKPLRIIRTPEPGALEFLHAMSVENIWPNKVDYSIIVPQKAAIFGASIPLELRFTPLLKGLELGDISIKLIEVRDCTAPGIPPREHKVERQVSSWALTLTREENWNDMIGDTGQEGWTASRKLQLPRRLRQCVQDVNHHGIKIRHKLKLVAALHNPDGHVSELRATLPVSIFISPNMPPDEHGVLVDQPGTSALAPPEADASTIAPPGYGEHVLDQLFEDVDQSGFHTPAIHSGVSSPFYSQSQSRAGSSENLAALSGMTTLNGVPPAALTSRLQNVSLNSTNRNTSATSLADLATSGSNPATNTSHPSQSASAALTRQNSAEDNGGTNNIGHGHLNPRSGRASPEHVEFLDVAMLSKVPSYSTALRTPARSQAASVGEALPDYSAAMSAASSGPSTPMLQGAGAGAGPNMVGVPAESSSRDDATVPRSGSMTPPRRPRPGSTGIHDVLQQAQGPEERRLHLMRARDRVY